VNPPLQQLAGNVIHCELKTAQPFDPPVSIKDEWYTDATAYPENSQVVFYCDNGELRSVQLGRWYKKQVGARQKVYLLLNGITKSKFAEKYETGGKLYVQPSCIEVLPNLIIVVDWKASVKYQA